MKKLRLSVIISKILGNLRVCSEGHCEYASSGMHEQYNSSGEFNPICSITSIILRYGKLNGILSFLYEFSSRNVSFRYMYSISYSKKTDVKCLLRLFGLNETELISKFE
jgi:hypothetical protein